MRSGEGSQEGQEGTVVVAPAAVGRQLVRASLPFAPGELPDGQGLILRGARDTVRPAVRVLTRHPAPEGVDGGARRALVTFPRDFRDGEPVSFEMAADGRPPEGPIPSGQAADVELDGDDLRVRCPGGPPLTLRFLAPPRSATAAPRVEAVEENPCFHWQRIHLPDPAWPRVLEVRRDALGGLVVVAHLQRLDAGDGSPPDLGWEIRGPAAEAELRAGGTRRPLTAGGEAHAFGRSATCEVAADGCRIDHPTAASRRAGRVEARLEGGRLEYLYRCCRVGEGVPMQPTSWRRVEVCLGPEGLAPLTPTLESPHEVRVAPRRWDALYDTGEPMDLSGAPALADLVACHHDAVVRSVAVGDEWGHVTSYDDDAGHGPPLGMARLNHCAPIFFEGWRSGDRRLVEAAVSWCDGFHDLGIWWGPDDPGGTRYPNSAGPERGNQSVSFCTKGYDAFFLAWEQTGDPRMEAALEAQVRYAAASLHADDGECRNVGDVRDFARLYRYTGETRYLDEALRLFRELRSRLSTGDLFDQGGKPLDPDPPFIASDADGAPVGYAKPYIIGYALAGLPELSRVAPGEPRLRDVVAAVADFLAASVDPLGGWRYPHPRSPSVMLNQAPEHAWQIVQADRLLGASPRHLDAVEAVLRQRLHGWSHTGRMPASLGCWELASGLVDDAGQLRERYRRPKDRDPRRDYTEGELHSGIVPPEGVVYVPEILAFYLQHRPASRLLAPPGPAEPLGQVLARTPPPGPAAAARCALRIDFGQRLEERIEAAGIGRVAADITGARFPDPRRGVVETEVEWVTFGRSLETAAVVDGLARRGLAPAGLAELVALAAARPVTGLAPAVALGSCIERGGRTFVCGLDRYAGAPRLILLNRDCGWVRETRFVAVPLEDGRR